MLVAYPFTNFEIMSSKSKVCFFFELKGLSLKHRNELKVFIELLFKKEGKRLESINYIFCSDKKLLKINQDFLGHDYYTDIITFDLSESNNTKAEVYISVDRVRENARSLNSSIQSELHRVIFHGALHLCGYTDKTLKQKKEIRLKEDQYLDQYFR